MSLTDAAFEIFQLLTQRPFLVMDCEYTRDPSGDGDRLISLAIVPVIRGARSRPRDLYVVMNPGVPIDAASTAVHGFTDAEVARKRTFAHYAPSILEALREPGAVLVTHTGADVRVLRRELERLDEARGDAGEATAPGLNALPDLPIIDTSALPGQLGYPGLTGRRIVSLATLCQLTGVALTDAHHARGDARATADALIKLLTHAASTARYASIEALLAAHDRGTTRDPRLPGYIRSRRDKDPVLPPEHLARHDRPLTHVATPAEQAAWLDRAKECAQLRCEHLRVEAGLAAMENGAALFDPFAELLGGLHEPGQPGTLLGALAQLIAPEDGPAGRALAHTRALRWWDIYRRRVRASAACADRRAEACPDCRSGNGCPRDTLYLPVTQVAILGERGVLDETSIRDRLFGKRDDRRIHAWAERHPAETAFMAWTVITHEDNAGRVARALEYLRVAVDKKLHLTEPRLALLACEQMAEEGRLDAAESLARAVLAKRTTDPAYSDLASWLDYRQLTRLQAERLAAPRVITHPRLARPPGRVNPNPYLPR